MVGTDPRIHARRPLIPVQITGTTVLITGKGTGQTFSSMFAGKCWLKLRVRFRSLASLHFWTPVIGASLEAQAWNYILFRWFIPAVILHSSCFSVFGWKLLHASNSSKAPRPTIHDILSQSKN